MFVHECLGLLQSRNEKFQSKSLPQLSESFFLLFFLEVLGSSPSTDLTIILDVGKLEITYEGLDFCIGISRNDG